MCSSALPREEKKRGEVSKEMRQTLTKRHGKIGKAKRETRVGK